ncbi:MAG: hypothetical protein MUF00_11260 [Gemmatimonadaceae bacterium]|jgi:hypothetical protein|nr:hypothetical protein [Gemmatimonadaceae bacterium]
MPTVEVVHIGVGVWMQRGDGAEILFPDAPREKKADSETCIEPHVPVLNTFLARGSSHRWPPVIRLDGYRLDLRGLTTSPSYKVDLESADFLAPLTIQKGYPAEEGDPFKTNKLVIGSASLPGGALFPYQGTRRHRYGTRVLDLGLGVVWAAEFSGGEISLTLSSGDQVFRFQPGPREDIHMMIVNVALSDLHCDLRESSAVDEDFPANWVVTGPGEVPRDPAIAEARSAGTPLQARACIPERPCYPAKGIIPATSPAGQEPNQATDAAPSPQRA